MAKNNKQEEHNETGNLVEKCTKILENNHNIILTGAPGTGKTYLAKQIASQLIFNKKYESNKNRRDFKSRVGFVQFHPSYDYTDFVEGLRPVNTKDDSSAIGFVRTDGVFKDFCKKATGTRTFANWREEVNEYIMSNTEIPNGNNKFTIRGFDVNGDIIIITEGNQYIIGSCVIDKAFNSQNFTDDWFKKELDACNIKFFPNQENEYIRFYYNALYTKIKNDLQEVKGYLSKYVFIIDEINRGELSKIFGELFYSIDPGYRGVAGRVKTQYQNLVENDDIFKDGFYVPDNVYIIGTMNDIDRSVDSMDFAFRRRFAFIEIKAEDNTDMLKELGEDLKKKAEKRMRALNAAISEIDGLSSAYHIGASYFLKLNNYPNNDAKVSFESLWNYHLEGLLREYLRGMPNVEDKVKDLKDAFDKENEQQ